MMKIRFLVNIALPLFVAYLCISSCDGLRSSGKGFNSKSDNKGFKEPGKSKTVLMSNSGDIDQNLPRRGLGISAWGIITLIVSLILAVAGLYYFSICYPVLCKKTRKYDMIGLPNTV